LMFFIYTKVFSFPTLHLQRGGVKHYHHGKKDKKWSVILRLTKYDFLLGSWGIFLSLAISFAIGECLGVCHFNFDPRPKLNYCSNPFIEHYWRCSNKGDVYNLALFVHVVLSIHPRYSHNCFSPH
jgi:hypothetical protein